MQFLGLSKPSTLSIQKRAAAHYPIGNSYNFRNPTLLRRPKRVAALYSKPLLQSELCSEEEPHTMGLLGFNFNLRDQLIFYGSYHSNPINQAIHFIFVPLILWTVAVWFAYTPALFHYDVAAHLAFLPAPLTAAVAK